MQLIYVPLRGCMCQTSALLRKQKQKARKGLAFVIAFTTLAKLRLSAWELFECIFLHSIALFSPLRKELCFTLGCLDFGKPKTQAVAASNVRKPKSQLFCISGALLASGEKFCALEYSPFGSLFNFEVEMRLSAWELCE